MLERALDPTTVLRTLLPSLPPSLPPFLIRAGLDGLRGWKRRRKALKTFTVQHLLPACSFLEPVLPLYQKYPQINLRKQVLEH